MTDNKLSKTVVMTMPKSYADRFLEETKTAFLDCRYMNVAFKDKMFNALYKYQGVELRAAINKALQELKAYRDEELKSMARNLQWLKLENKKLKGE